MRFLAAVALALVVYASSAAEAASWVTSRGDFERSGAQPALGDLPLEQLGLMREISLPFDASSSSPFRDVVSADLDGRPGLEIVVVNSGHAMALSANGAILWTRNLDAVYVGAPVVGDLTADGLPEVAFMTFGGSLLHVLDGATGVPLLQLKMERAVPPAPPLIVDLEGDGLHELVFAESGDRVTAARLHRTKDGPPLSIPVIGSPQESWGLATVWSVMVEQNAEVTTFTYADVDQDGEKDVVAAAVSGPTAPTSRLVAIRSDGSVLWSARLQVNGLTVQNVGDFHENPGSEVVIRFMRPGEMEGDHYYRLLDAKGNLLCSLGAGSDLSDSALALDLDGDARRELVFGDMRAQRYAPGLARDGTNVGAILAWRGCEVLWAQPLTGEPTHFSRYPAAADLDGDGTPEIVAPLGNGQVFIIGPDGAVRGKIDLPAKVPAAVTGLAIVDLDDDGALEILLARSHGALSILGRSAQEDAPRLVPTQLPAERALPTERAMPLPWGFAAVSIILAARLLRR